MKGLQAGADGQRRSADLKAGPSPGRLAFLFALVCSVWLIRSVGSAATPPRVTYVHKSQPVFRSGGEARITIDLEVPEVLDSRWHLFVGLSNRTGLQGDLRVIFSCPLDQAGLTPGKSKYPVSLTLPDDTPEGTTYVYGLIGGSPELTRSTVLSHKATKVAVISRDIDELSLRDLLGGEYLDSQGNPDLARVRTRLLSRCRALPADLAGYSPRVVADPVGLSDRFLSSGRYPLEFGEARFVPGPDTWRNRDHPSDSLELHTLRILQVLALAFDQTGRRQYLEAGVPLYRDWVKHNHVDSFLSPYAWNDHAVALRLRSLVAFATRLSQISGTDQQLAELLADIHRHSQVLAIWGFYSDWSNHGLFQDEALIAASVICDVFRLSPRWQRLVSGRTKEWFSGKVHGDGGLNEGSSGYQFLVLALALRVHELCAFAGLDDPEQEDLLRRMAELSKHLVKPDGRLVPLGDTSVGHKLDAGGWDAPLTRSLAERITEAGRQRAESGAVFPQSGYFACFAEGPEENDDLYLSFIFGLSTRATHFQDDILSFDLMLFSQDVLLDSGIHDYSSNPLNRYYRSASAHSTILFEDELPQPYSYRSLKTTRLDWCFATDSYTEIAASIVTASGSKVRRVLRVYQADSVVIVRDVFNSSSKEGATLLFQYAPQVRAEIVSFGQVSLALHHVQLVHHLISSSPFEASIHEGETNPRFMGWVAAEKGKSEPRATLCVRCQGETGEIISILSPAGVQIDRYLSDVGRAQVPLKATR